MTSASGLRQPCWTPQGRCAVIIQKVKNTTTAMPLPGWLRKCAGSLKHWIALRISDATETAMALDDSHHDDERAVALAVAERTVARYGDNVLRFADVETQLTAMKVMVYLA